MEETRNRTGRKRRISRKEWERRRKIRRRRALLARSAAAAVLLLFFVGLGFGIRAVYRHVLYGRKEPEKPEIEVNYLSPNPYSRPGDELKKVKNIFVHYTANPGTSAENNRSYFENLKDTQETSASAHFIIGYEGEIIQCLPLDEIGYAVKTRNEDSISIECCYLDENGKFTEETEEALLQLLDWLLFEYRLKPKDVLRHYDAGGKLCPLYYVEHEEAWKELLERL